MNNLPLNSSIKMSQTQHAAEQMIKQSQSIMHRCRITYEQWVFLLFENGIRFIENTVLPDLQQSFKTDKKIGFWDWWLVAYMEDDAKLLTFTVPLNSDRYEVHKEQFMLRKDVYDAFCYNFKSI